MYLPPIVYSLAFWKALTYAAAGILAALAALGKVPTDWALSAGALLSAVLTVLSWLGVTPELRAKQLQARLDKAEKLLAEAAVLRNDLLGAKQAKSTQKSK